MSQSLVFAFLEPIEEELVQLGGLFFFLNER